MRIVLCVFAFFKYVLDLEDISSFVMEAQSTSRYIKCSDILL